MDISWNTKSVASLIYEHYKNTAEDWRRNHMGASGIGRECHREIWLNFRWAKKEQKEGRMLRLLERGDREEPVLVRNLRDVGIQVWDRETSDADFENCPVEMGLYQETKGKRVVKVEWEVERFRDVDHGNGYREIRIKQGHFGGSVDAILLGIPQMTDIPVLGEFKTANDKSFARIKLMGIKKGKPEYYAQAQIYMGFLGLSHCLHITVKKSSDEIYEEIIPFDKRAFNRYRKLGGVLSMQEEAPAKRNDPQSGPCMLKSKDGTLWPCDYWKLCHGKQELMPERNCRTCISSTPQPDGRWMCEAQGSAIIDQDTQRVGCPGYAVRPDMLNPNCKVREWNPKTRRMVVAFDSGVTVTVNEGK